MKCLILILGCLTISQKTIKDVITSLAVSSSFENAIYLASELEKVDKYIQKFTEDGTKIKIGPFRKLLEKKDDQIQKIYNKNEELYKMVSDLDKIEDEDEEEEEREFWNRKRSEERVREEEEDDRRYNEMTADIEDEYRKTEKDIYISEQKGEVKEGLRNIFFEEIDSLTEQIEEIEESQKEKKIQIKVKDKKIKMSESDIVDLDNLKSINRALLVFNKSHVLPSDIKTADKILNNVSYISKKTLKQLPPGSLMSISKRFPQYPSKKEFDKNFIKYMNNLIPLVIKGYIRGLSDTFKSTKEISKVKMIIDKLLREKGKRIFGYRDFRILQEFVSDNNIVSRFDITSMFPEKQDEEFRDWITSFSKEKGFKLTEKQREQIENKSPLDESYFKQQRLFGIFKEKPISKEEIIPKYILHHLFGFETDDEMISATNDLINSGRKLNTMYEKMLVYRDKIFTSILPAKDIKPIITPVRRKEDDQIIKLEEKFKDVIQKFDNRKNIPKQINRNMKLINKKFSAIKESLKKIDDIRPV